MCDIPLDVDADEIIVRILKDQHVRNNNQKIHHSAFRPPADIDEVSVIRATHMGADFCKRKGTLIASDDYRGFAVLTARQIRTTGADVIDSRREFCGHADITNGVVLVRGTPAPHWLTARLKQLANDARCCLDPDPAVSGWTGEDFLGVNSALPKNG